MSTVLIDTWKTAPKRVAITGGPTLLVHIYPTGPGLGRCKPLTQNSFIIGRDDQCDLVIHHHSVSRRHARVHCSDGVYTLEDLQSTNGTYINDIPVTRAALADGDYVRIGNCIYRFLAGDNIEAAYHEELYRLIIIDALTDIPNKRCLMEFLDRELARTTRYGRPLSLVLFDIDRFKSINDRFGHLGGDFTLRELAACIKNEVRKEEMFARYGGEEFVIVLPETDAGKALEASERLRELVQNHAFVYDGEPFRVTISLGVVSTTGDRALTPQEILRRADDNLYQAKRAGCNRVVA
jgi:diguanylate cyclase (GGDEF)-like protein